MEDINNMRGRDINNKNQPKTTKFNKLLVAFSVLPMITAIIIMLLMLISASSREIKKVTQNSMLSLVKETGAGFESYIHNEEVTLKNFAKSPIVIEFLQNQNDTAALKQSRILHYELF